MILELVHAYQANGNAALGRYDDGGEPLTVAEQFRALLTSSKELPHSGAGAHRVSGPVPAQPPRRRGGFLLLVGGRLWPQTDPPGQPCDHSIRWQPDRSASRMSSRSSSSMRATISTPPSSCGFSPTMTAGPDRRGFYLLSIIRSRSDGTTGLKGSLLRPIISRRSRNAVRGYLEYLKRQVERPASAPFLSRFSQPSDRPSGHQSFVI